MKKSKLSLKSKSYINTFIVLFLSVVCVEVIFRLISHLSIFGWQMVRISLFAAIFSSLVSLLTTKLPNVLRKIIYALIIFLVAGYACLQLGFNNFIGVYASLNTSSQLGKVTDYISDFLRAFSLKYLLTFIPFVLSILYLIFLDRKANKVSFKKSGIVTLIVLIICVPLLWYTTISTKYQNKFQTISNKDLFRTAANPSLAIDNFGVFGFFFLDVKSVIAPQELDNSFYVNKKETVETDYSRHMDDTIWLSVNEETTNSTYKSLNEYFMNRSITAKNDMTGVFEGKNVIFILMESTGDLFINEEYFPNFYKMYTNGYAWENNYSPRNSCATMNNEFSGLVSLYSISNNCTASVYKNNKYPESVFNLFNNKGYVTFSAHDYPDNYYPRRTIHPNMGSGEFYDAPKLKMDYQNEYVNWANDMEFFEKILGVIDSKDYQNNHFMTWLTTVSAHQPYVYEWEGYTCKTCNEYYSMTEGSGLKPTIRYYYSKLKIQDEALGILMDGLEERGILDDTVFVLYGDHYPYGISNSVLNPLFDYDITEDLSMEQVPFVIYSTSISDPQVFTDYTSYINILPTVANLFNLDYDPRYYMGTDLFSEDYESRVVFADGTWKNEYAFFDAKKNKIKYYTEDFTYTDEEINRINSEIESMIKVSSKAITSNYFNYLRTSMDKKIEEAKVLEAAKQAEENVSEPTISN